ncbi:MAG: hypothetical protein JW772_00940 [Candidatus Diapherotrites archaeon]|nr:hypothetical protein [Candidatus Diapherotrites archaeon]
MDPKLEALLKQVKLTPEDREALDALVRAEMVDLGRLMRELERTREPITRQILIEAIRGQRREIADENLLRFKAHFARKKPKPPRNPKRRRRP